jgi:hypothetical protein
LRPVLTIKKIKKSFPLGCAHLRWVPPFSLSPVVRVRKVCVCAYNTYKTYNTYLLFHWALWYVCGTCVYNTYP